MLTSEFKYFKFPFSEFNKVQASVVPYFTKDVNLVVSFKTASGKTSIASGIFGYELNISKNTKCVYTSPYKAISSQKYDDWNNSSLNEYGIVLCTSDNISRNEELDEKRVIILTTESFDSKIRNIAYHKWLRQICCLVVDEAHLLGQEGRGDVIESFLMKFSIINPKARIILLSATMSNCSELAKWIKMLNGKDTLCFHSNWRPSSVCVNFYTFEKDNSYEKKLEIAKELSETGNKTIIFVHSKKTGKELLRIIRSSGRSCAFHYGGLSYKQRKNIEKAFDNPLSGLNILISTSTLSSGVNL